jgi:RND family efflux transporter MFP subunit
MRLAVSLRVSAAAFAAALFLTACGKGGPPAAAGPAPADRPAAAAPVLLVSAEDLRTVGGSGRAGGPVVSGSIQPEKRADLRAEVSAVVLQVLKENGEPVKAGELLVKLDDTSLRDSLASAEESARAAGQAFDQAERTVQRLKTLQAQGMTSVQALDDAEVRRNAARSEQAAARARVVAARQQLQRTLVRAPFDGVVSDRKVSAGDTAAVGKELLKVIDPRSMRFEGTVSADRMHEIQLGQDVEFRVNGFPDTRFAGKVRRIDAAANAMTRQVALLVAFADAAAAPRVAGLYAEGRIVTAAAAGSSNGATPSLPEASIRREGGTPYVWRVNAKDKALEKVAVQLGERDARSGEYPVKGGLAEGDRVLRNPSATLVAGQKVELAGPTTTAAASSAAVR